MPSLRALEEGNKRGLLNQKNKALYLQAVKRGMIQEQAARPQPSMLDKIAGGAETVGALASGMVAEPAAGLIGLGGAVAGGPEMGAGMTEEARKMLTYEPRTQVGRENLQSMAESDIVQAMGRGLQSAESGLGEIGMEAQGPELATAMHTLPTAAMEAAGAGIPGVLGRLAGRAGRGRAARAQGLGEEIEQIRAPGAEAGLQQVADTMKGAKMDEVTGMIKPDPEFFRAADELGMSVEPLASFVSQNPQFRAIEQALKSVPASQLDDQSKKFITNLGQKADELIAEYGGTTDKAGMSDRFRVESEGIIGQIGIREDALYDVLGIMIPPSTQVNATNAVNFVQSKIRELGGKEKSPPLFNKIIKHLGIKETKTPVKGRDLITGKKKEPIITTTKPTYERLSQTRKEIGQAIYKKSGPFKNEEVGLLKKIYSNLKKDQDLIASTVPGGGHIKDAANMLTIQRKQIESNLVSLLGKNLEGSILPVVGTDMRNLVKKGGKKWDETMKKIHDPAMRQEVVVTALNEVFTGGMSGKGKSLSTKQFSQYMDELNRQPSAKARLYKELPPKAQKAMDNLHKISKAVARAEDDAIQTGRLVEFFNQKEGLIKRMIGGGMQVAAYAKGGMMGGQAMKEFLQQTTDGSKTTAKLLASPEFSSMLKVAVRDGYTEGAAISKKLQKKEKAFERSRLFAQWQDNLTNSQRARLLSIGTVGYLMNKLPEGEPED